MLGLYGFTVATLGVGCVLLRSLFDVTNLTAAGLGTRRLQNAHSGVGASASGREAGEQEYETCAYLHIFPHCHKCLDGNWSPFLLWNALPLTGRMLQSPLSLQML